MLSRFRSGRDIGTLAGAAAPEPNRLLASLTQADSATLAPYLRPVMLRAEEVLFHPGDEIDVVHFPCGAAVVSLVSVLQDGRGAEAATIGREGAVGGIVSGGRKPAFCRASVQIAGPALRLESAHLEEAKSRSLALRDSFSRYADCLLAQLQQSVVCNAVHPLEARLARWLLTTHDRVGDAELRLTQDAMAEMLGARRTTVSPVAGALQRRGLIMYRHGRVRVLNRAGLRAAACECHAAVWRHFQAVAPGLYPATHMPADDAG